LKGCWKKRSWPNYRYYSGIRLTGIRVNVKNLSQDDGRCTEFGKGFPEYEAGVIVTRFWRSNFRVDTLLFIYTRRCKLSVRKQRFQARYLLNTVERINNNYITQHNIHNTCMNIKKIFETKWITD
jgi:hypothetical protein